MEISSELIDFSNNTTRKSTEINSNHFKKHCHVTDTSSNLKYHKTCNCQWLNIGKHDDDEEQRENLKHYSIYNVNENEKKIMIKKLKKCEQSVNTIFKENDGSISLKMINDVQNIDVTRFIKKFKISLKNIDNDNSSICENLAKKCSIENFPTEFNKYLKFPNDVKAKLKNVGNLYKKISLEITYFDNYISLNKFSTSKSKKDILDLLLKLSFLLDNIFCLNRQYILKLNYLNILVNKSNNPTLLIYPDFFFTDQFSKKQNETFNYFLGFNCNENSSPSQYYSKVFAISILHMFFNKKSIDEFILNVNSFKVTKDDPFKNIKKEKYFEYLKSQFDEKFLEQIFLPCIDPDSSSNVGISEINRRLKKYCESFNSKEINLNNNNIETVNLVNYIPPEYVQDNKENKTSIAFNETKNMIDQNIKSELINLKPVKFEKNFKIKNIPQLNINFGLKLFYQKKQLKIEGYIGNYHLCTKGKPKNNNDPILNDNLILNETDLNRFKEIFLHMIKRNFSSYGAHSKKNLSDLNEDTLDQMMKGEFLVKNEIKFFAFLHFLQTHYDNLLNESESIIKLLMNKLQCIEGQLKDLHVDSEIAVANKGNKKNKKEIKNSGEIINKVKNFLLPRELFSEIYQLLDSKGASKIAIKALTNSYYIDLRELELHEPKIDIKLVIEVLKINNIFTSFLVNQYDQIRLIYEGRTKSIDDLSQKFIYEKIKERDDFQILVLGIIK